MDVVQAGKRTLRGITKPFDAQTTAKARKFMKPGSAANVWLFRVSHGYLGSRWRVGRKLLRGIPVGLFTSTGRKSGQRRTVPLLYMSHGDSVVIVASQGGMPRHPDWYFNICADPHVTVELRGRKFEALAEVADAQRRAELWPLLVDMYPSFAVYQARAQREIPVVLCRPIR